MYRARDGHWVWIKTRRIGKAFAGARPLEKTSWVVDQRRVCYDIRKRVRYICIAWALGLGYTTGTK